MNDSTTKRPASSGLLEAFLLDGKGAGRPLSWDDVHAWTPAAGPLWVHLDTERVDAQTWLREHSGLGEAACDGLLAGGTRPRCTPIDGGLLVFLRGVNLSPGADPEDMVALRLWAGPSRVISLNRRRLLATGDLASEIRSGNAPDSSASVLSSLAGHLLERMAPTMNDLEEAVDELEERALSDSGREVQEELAELRRQVIALRRHLAPQREAMILLSQSTADFLDAECRDALHLLADQVARYVEGLDELRERAAVTNDLLAGRQADTMNRRMFALSLIAAIFLPLGLIAGLLGINVSGIPGAENDWGFALVCTLMLVLGVLEFWILRRIKWWA